MSNVEQRVLVLGGERPLNRILTSPEVIWLSCGS